MTLLQAISEHKSVCLTFIDVERDKQWSISFSQFSKICEFFSPIAGELIEPTEDEGCPYDYYKVLFVSEGKPDEPDEDAFEMYGDDIAHA